MRKLYYLFALLALTALCANTASANPIDPRVGLGGGGSCASFNQNSGSLNVIVPTGCIVDFTNNIPGYTITNLIVTINTAFTGVLSCVIDLTQPGNGGVSPFSFGQVTAPNQCTFSGPPQGPIDAVLPGGSYGIQFGYAGAPFQTCDSNGVCTALSSLSLTITTPEPASLALIGAGLLAIFASRKKLLIKRSAS
jgi:hypothetical protein